MWILTRQCFHLIDHFCLARLFENFTDVVVHFISVLQRSRSLICKHYSNELIKGFKPADF